MSLFVILAILILQNSSCLAADKAKIQEAIKKAQGYIIKQNLQGSRGALGALAYVKSGGDKKAQPIQTVLQESLQKIHSGAYQPSLHHIYEACVDLMLFEAMDPEKYREEIKLTAAYIINSQLSNGSWFYPGPKEPDAGDTSITQYALLGLWAAARAGIEIPPEVWDKAVRWHVTKQKEDGGFCYHPFELKKENLDPDERLSSCTMTAGGTSSLLITRRMLFADAEFESSVKPAEAKRRFGVVEKFVEDKPTTKHVISFQPSVIDASVSKSVRWMVAHFGEKSRAHTRWMSYDLYSIERVSALLDIDSFGGHDWYNEGSDELVLKQTPEGSWKDECTELPATAFGLMFLTKATLTIIKPIKKVPVVGGGLQAGGRGLPDNLGAVNNKDGTVATRKIVGAVDNLLIELERSSDAKVEDVQQVIVDAVQLDKPEELIGQIDRLRKLAVDSRLEVRRTAIWALGRTGDVSTTPVLIRSLSDPDLSVVREASFALCVLSRRLEGCDLPVDPTDDTQMGLREDSTEENRKSVLDNWRLESAKRWTEWYMKNRTYSERDDRTSLKKK